MTGTPRRRTLIDPNTIMAGLSVVIGLAALYQGRKPKAVLLNPRDFIHEPYMAYYRDRASR